MKITNTGEKFIFYLFNTLLFSSLYRLAYAKYYTKKLDLNYFIDEFFVLLGVLYFYMFGLFVYNIVYTLKKCNKSYIERELEDSEESEESENTLDDIDNYENFKNDISYYKENSENIKQKSYFNFYNRFDIWNTENSDESDNETNNLTQETKKLTNQISENKNTNKILDKCDCNDCSNKEINNTVNLADRMKNFETFNKINILPYEPFIVRIDGRNFSKLTKTFFKKPVDNHFTEIMRTTAYELFQEFKPTIVHVASDEINLVFNAKCTKKDYQYNPKKYQHLFGGKTCKILSIIPSFATSIFTKLLLNNYKLDKLNISFDSKLILTPYDKDYELINYLYWRSTIDSYRNLLSMYCYEYFTDAELLNMSIESRIKLLENKVDFTNLPNNIKYGWFIKNELLDKQHIDIKYKRKRVIALSFKLNYSDYIKDKLLNQYLENRNFEDIKDIQYYEF